MHSASAPTLLAFLVLPAAACRVASPQELVDGVPSPPAELSVADAEVAEAAAGGLDLAVPGEGISLPPSCRFDSSSVRPTTAVDVPAGEFAMGCDSTTDSACSSDEDPEHMVALDDFAIDVTEVTQAQYAACVEAGACTLPYCVWDACTTPNLPITCVDRAQAMDYCAFIREELPTEAQWEKAARGTDGRKYPWGNDEVGCDFANIAGCNDGGAVEVGLLAKGASPYGALDMAGNVVEWTLDVYDATYYARSPTADPTGPVASSDSSFVGRGGGWRSTPAWDRTGARDSYNPRYVKDSIGFRCVTQGSRDPAIAP
jgi:formylglycine-generating enzyme required for sulfatase activity